MRVVYIGGGLARGVMATSVLTSLVYITAVVVGVPSPLGKCVGLNSKVILVYN